MFGRRRNRKANAFTETFSLLPSTSSPPKLRKSLLSLSPHYFSLTGLSIGKTNVTDLEPLLNPKGG
jgi:hypothetical protein